MGKRVINGNLQDVVKGSTGKGRWVSLSSIFHYSTFCCTALLILAASFAFYFNDGYWGLGLVGSELILLGLGPGPVLVGECRQYWASDTQYIKE